jgi:hypothetical protein
LTAICETARLWSRRIIDVMFSAGKSGAWRARMAAFVLAGLPTTRTRASRRAEALSARPCPLKISALALSRLFCDAVERRDGKRFAGLFCEDGVYHDVFYGAFAGRAKIAEMIDWFFKTAAKFRVAILRLKDGRIAEYREVANTGTRFADMNFAPERIAKILLREGNELKSRPETAGHLA